MPPEGSSERAALGGVQSKREQDEEEEMKESSWNALLYGVGLPESEKGLNSELRRSKHRDSNFQECGSG